MTRKLTSTTVMIGRTAAMPGAAVGGDEVRTAMETVIALPAVLLGGDVIQPVDVLSVEFFLDRYVRHRRGRRSAVPMLFIGGKPHHVAGVDFLYRSALALNAADAGGDYQGLSERMGVPCRAGTRLKGDAPGRCARGFGRCKKWIDAYRAGEPFWRSPSRRLRADALDLHWILSFQATSRLSRRRFR